jgi:hypothetical protein
VKSNGIKYRKKCGQELKQVDKKLWPEVFFTSLLPFIHGVLISRYPWGIEVPDMILLYFIPFLLSLSVI